ncbi:MAG TPA: GNAT family N-acetyltransferase [bacterium]|nr:GNAT family N-acetyltransferase [bacterium]
MQEGYLVRDYRSGDWTAVEALWTATGMGGAYRGDTAEVVRRTLDVGARLLVMERRDTGEVVGTAWLTHDTRRSYLHHFGILPAYQGKKLANDLMAATLKAAREMGFQCKLEVHRENVAAVTLYQKIGFKRLGDYDVYIMRDL